MPVWEHWNALTGPARRDAWREADARHLALPDSVDGSQRAALRIPYFSGPLSVPEYASYRLSEQSVHAWDVEVAVDSA
ncbi:maleylpyruvate isomerase N-terminal domain-containing protein [Streptomyces glomeratus]|uniref:Mycothiol-dependent maleylpyruvate isomerase metal-binding domain-containing protein n=1 Tax=Streptomyces glomeratus TaxID=284452 RepID=A0ABP6LW52_9ACTN|nr:hypothetical protein [Streptomyces glomeratus]MCF1510102.1 hypothetical protein [Streptomyces glomeratus]